jgi:hypothetical protein
VHEVSKLSLAAATALAMAALVAARAAAAPPADPGAGWVTYPVPAGVDQSLTVTRTVQGTLTLSPLGCSFALGGDVAAGAEGAQWDQVAFNAASCQAIYLVGPVQPVGDEQQATIAGGGAATVAVSAAKRHLARATSFTRAAYIKTWYEDPATIDVSSLRNDVEWTSNGSCNTYYKWKRHAGWLAASGWYLKWVGDSPYIGCNNAISNSHAKMENDIFCWAVFNDPENVWTTYNYDHKVSGHPGGGYSWAYNDYVNSTLSICYRLLSHHASTNFETPW